MPFRGAGPLAVSPLEGPAGFGPTREDDLMQGPGEAEMAARNEEPAEQEQGCGDLRAHRRSEPQLPSVSPEAAPPNHDSACEAGVMRARSVPVGPTRQEREDHEAAGHVPYRSWCRACVAGRGRSDAHSTAKTSHSAVTTIGIDYGYLEDRRTVGEQEAGPSPILVTRSSSTQVTTADVLPCKGTGHPWCVQALVRAIVAAGSPKVIIRSDNEPAIADLKRQAAAECRVRHGMTVILEDTTEYDSQSNGLAEVAVREVKGVARSMKFALGELYHKDIGSKHPILPWLVAYAAGQITRGQIGPDGQTPHQRLKGRAFRKLLPVFGECVMYLPIGKRTSRLQERWSDGLFLGVVDRSSDFYVGTALGVVRARSLRRRPVEERASPELLDKLVGVPWQPVPGDPDSTAVPTVNGDLGRACRRRR